MISDTDIKEKCKILQHARAKFHKQGFYKIPMDEIARDLRISKKTIYKHFPSKEDLLKEICNNTSEELNCKISTIIDGEGTAVTKFVKLLGMYSRFMMTISENWLQDMSIHAPHIKANLDEYRDNKIMSILTKLLEQGKKEKLVENYPPSLIISIFTSSIYTIINPDYLLKSGQSLQAAFRTTYDILLNGILTEKGKEEYQKSKRKLEKELKF